MALYLLSLALTVAVECLLVPLVARLGGPRPRAVMDVVWFNLLSHPPATVLWQEASAPFLLVEAAVVTVEALLYARISGLGLRRGLILSLALNIPTAALSAAF